MHCDGFGDDRPSNGAFTAHDEEKTILELWSGERVISASCAKMGFDTEDHEVFDQEGRVVLEHNLLVIETINGIEKTQQRRGVRTVASTTLQNNWFFSGIQRMYTDMGGPSREE